MKWPAKRVSQCSPKSFGMYEEAAKLMAQGEDVIHLEVGRPSFDTPQHIKDATIQSLQEGNVHYGEFPGSLKLREAICNKLGSYNKLNITPDNVLVTNGLTHAAVLHKQDDGRRQNGSEKESDKFYLRDSNQPVE